MKKVVKPLASMTRLEAEKESKIRAGKMAEELDVLGQDSEKGAVKWVQEKGKEEEKKVDRKKAELEWKLDESRKQVLTYGDLLLRELRIIMEDWEDQKTVGYKWAAVKDKKGICLWIRDYTGNYYAKGIQISYIPKYDMNAIERLVVKACDFMDSMEKKKNPIITASQRSSVVLS